MLTYSTGQPPVDALKLQSLQAVFNLLPDNTQKLIAPKDVRDGIFTTWENIAFKPTRVSTSDVEYIGIDQPLLKSKIFFGKKEVGGKEIMNDQLLKELEFDYYFYGTRTEPTTEHNTRLGFLAGTGSLYLENELRVPYIEAREVTNVDFQKYINFEIRNKSYIWDGTKRVGGDINILSDQGKISLNGLVIPKVSDNLQPNNNDKYLKFIWDEQNLLGVATWSSIQTAAITDISSSGQVTISGNPVLINGRNVNFTESTPMPQAFGGWPKDSTFNNVPVTEVLRQLLYPYLAPSITSSFEKPFIEVGDTAEANTQKFNFTIQRPGTYSLTSLTGINVRPSTTPLPSANSVPQGQSNYSVFPFFNPTLPAVSGFSLSSFTLTISDSYPTTKPTTSNFRIVLPWFYGTSNTATSNLAQLQNVLGNITKLLRGEALANETVELSLSTSNLTNGVGCVYFGYPAIYRDLVDIKDQSGFSIISKYTKFTLNGVRSPQNYWGGSGDPRSYKFYIYTPSGTTPGTTEIPPLSKYKFIFGT